MARFWAPDRTVSEQLARELIAAQFPQLGPRSLEPFGAGMDNAAFLVNETYVFRFPQRDIAAPLLEREAELLPLIAPHLPQPIPVPEFTGSAQDGYPWIFSGYRRIRGTSACGIPLDEAQRRALAPALGRFLRALHGMDPRDAVARGLPGDLIGRMDHTRRLPLARERFQTLERQGLIEKTQVFVEYLESVAPGDLGPPHTILHGDLYARHILLDEDASLSGIIDWGDLHLGHPAIDLSIAHSMLPQSAHAAFIEAYGNVDERTWELARYRAIYHGALVADFGVQIADDALRNAGLTGLAFIREAL